MKNYLVKSLFEITSANWHVMDRSHEQDLYRNYVAMHQVSVGSYKQHLQGDWELKFVGGRFQDINQAFERTFWFIHDLWHSEPCNILYTDPDTVAVRPIDIWDDFDRFMMFNHTDPKSFEKPNPWNQRFEHFFNAGVRYFPADMSESTWEVGCSMAQDWRFDTYDTEQIILNAMLWSQGITLEQALRPDIAYQAQWLPMLPVAQQDAWNGITIDQAAIIHVHGSRDSRIKLDFMKSLTQ